MSCRLCKGDMSLSATTHAVDTGKRLIVVRNVPCLKCTQCGEAVYTGDTVEKLEKIVNTLGQLMTEIAVVEYSDVDTTDDLEAIEAARAEYENGETVNHNAINWD